MAISAGPTRGSSLPGGCRAAGKRRRSGTKCPRDPHPPASRNQSPSLAGGGSSMASPSRQTQLVEYGFFPSGGSRIPTSARPLSWLGVGGGWGAAPSAPQLLGLAWLQTRYHKTSHVAVLCHGHRHGNGLISYPTSVPCACTRGLPAQHPERARLGLVKPPGSVTSRTTRPYSPRRRASQDCRAPVPTPSASHHLPLPSHSPAAPPAPRRSLVSRSRGRPRLCRCTAACIRGTSQESRMPANQLIPVPDGVLQPVAEQPYSPACT